MALLFAVAAALHLDGQLDDHCQAFAPDGTVASPQIGEHNEPLFLHQLLIPAELQQVPPEIDEPMATIPFLYRYPPLKWRQQEAIHS